MRVTWRISDLNRTAMDIVDSLFVIEDNQLTERLNCSEGTIDCLRCDSNGGRRIDRDGIRLISGELRIVFRNIVNKDLNDLNEIWSTLFFCFITHLSKDDFLVSFQSIGQS
jgi:hypothetical protein